VCLVLLLKLLLLFKKPKALAFQSCFFCQSSFSSSTKLKAALTLLLPAVDVSNFEKITHPPPLKKLTIFELFHSPQQLFHSLQLTTTFSKVTAQPNTP